MGFRLIVATIACLASLLAESALGQPRPHDKKQNSNNALKNGTNALPQKSDRARRAERWDIRFRYVDGNDYAQQLSDLGMYVALPGEDDGKYLLVKELNKRPVQADVVKAQDLSALNLMFFLNEDPESAKVLGEALGLKPLPTRFWAFMPRGLETDLTEQERKAAPNKKEDEIKKTVFRVVGEDKSIKVVLVHIE